MAAIPDPTRSPSRDTGFSLVEIIVSLAVFAVFAVAAASVAMDSLGAAGDNRDRVRAASLAEANIERARAQFRRSPDAVLAGTVSRTEVVAGHVYTVEAEATWLDAAGNDTADGVALTAATGDVLRYQVRVSWPNLGNRPPVISTTVFS